MRKLAMLLGVLFLAGLWGCSDRNGSAPLPNQPHPAGWILSHGAQATTDLDGCKVCHGADFAGSGKAVSCFSCHLAGPPFAIHPASWQNVVQDHQTFPENYSWTNCANGACHGADLHGGKVTDASGTVQATGPSCFTTTCHAGGPPAPHATGFQDPALHGPQAKPNQLYCRNCHGRPPNIFDGGMVADPAILNVSLGNCSGCHPAAKAHPTGWQGTDNTDPNYQASHQGVNAQTIQTSCALCHKTDGPGAGPMPGAPSCFSASFTNADGSTNSCHSGGPGGAPHPVGSAWLDPSGHGVEAKKDLSYCQTCHGTPGTIQFDGGSTGVACSSCHTDAKAHPTFWQGTDYASSTDPTYAASHRTAGNLQTACSICHDYTQGRTAPNPNAPSCFSASYTNPAGTNLSCHASGPGAPHPVGAAWLAPSGHGAEAKKDLTYCEGCHAQPADGGAGSNPRFNVAIGNLTNGCEDCHNDRTAHPSAGGRDNTHWYGTYTHATAQNFATACALCHGANLNGTAEGGVGPACTSCHTAGSPLTLANCTSCHNTPPDGLAPAGATFPNRAGRHVEHNQLANVTGDCSTCHSGAGMGTDQHYATSPPAVVNVSPTYQAKTGTPAYDATAQTCSGVSCHGGQATPNWYTGSLPSAASATTSNDYCWSCHAYGTSQYNSYVSGRHDLHVNQLGKLCTDCHNTTVLQNGVGGSGPTHWSNLNTSTFELDPAATVGGAGTQVNSYVGTTCQPACHGSETW